MAIPRKLLTVKRPTAATGYTGGVAQTESRTSFNIRASVQPLTPEEMQLLPEGRRQTEGYRLYTDTRLIAANSKTGVNADLVEYEGADYEVFAVDRWKNGILPHYKVLVAKV